jgi:hypothetical protein
MSGVAATDRSATFPDAADHRDREAFQANPPGGGRGPGTRPAAVVQQV